MREAFSGVNLPDNNLPDAIMAIGRQTGTQFVIIIDEWDLFLRDNHNTVQEQQIYIGLLRRLFKSEVTNQYIALAYITGILPIIRYSTESALNNFSEFKMLNVDVFANYIGFTENEVRVLCEKHNTDYTEASK